MSRHHVTAAQAGHFKRKPLVAALQGTLLCVAICAFLPEEARAQAASQQAADSQKTFNIPAGRLDAALDRFARTAGVNLSYDAELVEGRSSKGLDGTYSVAAGLASLLSGSGVEAMAQPGGGFVLQKAAPRGARESTLPMVHVSADNETSTGPVQGYVARRSATATKTDTSILEIPQSVSVIGRAEMEARGAQNLMDVVAYTPGISVNTYGPDNRGWEYISLRGFSDYSGNYRDGLPQIQFEIVYRMTEPYGLERVDVLRGPASVLFGQGDAGGILNRVSKQPTGERIREVEVQVGSFDRRQVAFDLGDKVAGSDDLSFRLVGLALDSNDQDRYPDGKEINRSRYYLAPSLRWQPSAATSLTLMGEFLRHDSDEDPYYAIAGDGSLTRIKMGDYSFSRFKQKQDAVGYQFEHVINDAWTFRQNARYSDTSLERGTVWNVELQPDGHTYTREARTWDDGAKQTSIDTQLQGKLKTGNVEHTVLLGMDWNHLDGNVYRHRGAAPDLDLLDPRYGLDIPPPPLSQDYTQKMSQIGIYAQDQIRIDDHWIVTLGGRQDHVKRKTDDTFNATRDSQSDSAFSGRAGLSYLVGNGWAPYVSYAESFLPSAGVDADNNPFKPSRGKQVETGIKYQPVDSRSLYTAAVFDLRKTNIVGYQDLPPYEPRQIGKQRVRGLELEAKTELTRNLSVVASYTWLDAKILESADSTEQGKVPVGVPKQVASIWLDYEMGGGFGIGGGAIYTGEVQNDEANTSTEGGYTLVNAMMRYDVGQWRFSLNASNLFDRKYNTICYHGECYLGAERTVTATARYRF